MLYIFLITAFLDGVYLLPVLDTCADVVALMIMTSPGPSPGPGRYNKPMRGTVYLGDNKPLSVDGSGRVKLRMFDGVIRSIECCHVPGMKRNLISLSTLDSQGYKYHAEGGVLKVCKGSMVLIKGSLVSGLYVLQGSVITGEAATASGSGDQDLT